MRDNAARRGYLQEVEKCRGAAAAQALREATWEAMK